jgi:superoxide dismutase, Cu-Zn family
MATKQLTIALGIVGIAGLTLGGSLIAQQPTSPAAHDAQQITASAKMIDGEGRSVGEVRVRQAQKNVLLTLTLKNATPGVHGLHIHEVGQCNRPSFESAGGHFNPDGRQHGFLNARGPHAGDLPNIEIPTTTEMAVEFLVPNVTLDHGPRSLLDSNGSAVVIHSGKDDYANDPAGHSGDRLACGAIVRLDAR